MERFFNKVLKTNNCWNWTGALRNGYGAFKLKGKVVGAHRYSWELHNNKTIPEDLIICHKCDNPKCVNPKHLFLGTYSDNSKDAFNKKRVKVPTNTQFQKGHKAINRSLKSAQEISYIKEQISKRKGSLKDLSILLGVSEYLLRDINSGRVYK